MAGIGVYKMAPPRPAAAAPQANGGWTVVPLETNHVLTGSVAFAETPLNFTLAAGKTYEIEFFGIVDTDTATNGLGFDFSITGAVPTIWGQFFGVSNASNGGAINGAGIVNSAATTSTSVAAGAQALGSLPATTMKYAVMGKFICVTTVENVLTLRMCGEGAVTGQTLYAGLSHIKYREITQ